MCNNIVDLLPFLACNNPFPCIVHIHVVPTVSRPPAIPTVGVMHLMPRNARPPQLRKSIMPSTYSSPFFLR